MDRNRDVNRICFTLGDGEGTKPCGNRGTCRQMWICGGICRGKSSRTPYWMDQALEWMEEKNFTFEGGGRLEGAVPGDVALDDMASNAIERKVMQRATMATGRRWLSQVISATGDSVATISGVPNKEQWVRVVEKAMKKMKKGRHQQCISTKARATVGCICERDVVLCAHGVSPLRLALVETIKGKTATING